MTILAPLYLKAFDDFHRLHPIQGSLERQYDLAYYKEYHRPFPIDVFHQLRLL